MDDPVLDPVLDRWNIVDTVPPVAPPKHRPRRPHPEAGPIERSTFSRLDPDQETEGLILVKGTTTPQSLAFAIQGYIFNDLKMPTIRAIGAGAVGQACKAIAIARGYVATRGVDLGCAIGFDNVPGEDGGEISAQTFRLFMR